MDNWVLLAFLAAFLIAFTNIVTKHLNTNLNEYSVGWARNLFSLPVFWITLWLSGIPTVNPKFWPVLVLIAPVEVLVAILYFRAIKSAPISVAIPMTSFNSLFIAIGAFALLGEKLIPIHLVAFLLLITGVYLLNIRFETGYGLLYPFKQLRKEHGAIVMLTAGLLFGITVPIGKLLTSYSSSQFYTAIYFTLFVILFTPIFLKKGTNGLVGIKNNFKQVALMGLLNGLYLFILWRAYSLGPGGLVSAIASTNILISVIIAGTFLREKEFPKRLIAATIMTIGVILIAINR
jgi:drug/metabolite transporter (DMT)-like permease